MKYLSFFYFSLIFLFIAQAQEVRVKGVMVVNGGQFGNAADNVNIQFVDPDGQSFTSLDTIQTQSAQDAVIDGTKAYIAAQDSIVLYDLPTGERLAATAFGGPSTIHMELYGDYLLVGNWYPPFGFTGPYPNHFRIFDRETLAFVDSIPAITQPAKSFLVVGDDLYVSQNLTSSAFTDSAGWLIRVDLTTLSVMDSMSVNSNQEELGRLVYVDSVIYGINDGSNTLTTYDMRTGIASTDTANADFQPNAYGSRLSVDGQEIIKTVIDGKIASYDLAARMVVNASLVDTVITAFAHDTLNDQYYVTQTDFATYTQGRIYDGSGVQVAPFQTGSAPEVAEVVYNVVPMAMNDWDTVAQGASVIIPVTLNDSDSDSPNLPSLGTVFLTDPTQGSASMMMDSISYTPYMGFLGTDSLEYVVVDEWGDSASAWVYVLVTQANGIELQETIGISVFPNPATHQVYLEFDQAWTGKVDLLDSQGRVLQRHTVDHSQLEMLQVDQLPTGVYFLRGRNENEFWHQRLIKN